MDPTFSFFGALGVGGADDEPFARALEIGTACCECNNLWSERGDVGGFTLPSMPFWLKAGETSFCKALVLGGDSGLKASPGLLSADARASWASFWPDPPRTGAAKESFTGQPARRLVGPWTRQRMSSMVCPPWMMWETGQGPRGKFRPL